MAARDLYSREEETRTADGRDPRDWPEFELEHSPDDLARPTEVTVFNPDPSGIATHWITVDAETAVDLREIA